MGRTKSTNRTTTGRHTARKVTASEGQSDGTSIISDSTPFSPESLVGESSCLLDSASVAYEFPVLLLTVSGRLPASDLEQSASVQPTNVVPESATTRMVDSEHRCARLVIRKKNG